MIIIKYLYLNFIFEFGTTRIYKYISKVSLFFTYSKIAEEIMLDGTQGKNVELHWDCPKNKFTTRNVNNGKVDPSKIIIDSLFFFLCAI